MAGTQRSTRIALLAFATLIAPVLAPLGRAATFTVDTTLDVVDALPGDGVCATAAGTCSLRAAVQESKALLGPDTIILPSGIYTLTIAGAGNNSANSGDLDISEDLTIVGAGARTTIIDGNRLDRVFDVANPAMVSISGVTIRNGLAPGTSDGGGIATLNGALTLTDVAFIGNSAGRNGGAIYVSGSSAVLTDVAIIGNSAGDAGGMFMGGGNLSLTNVTISGNSAVNDGGGLQVANVTAGLINVTITANSAAAGGGIFRTIGTVVLRNSIVANNSPGGNCNTTVVSAGNNLDSGNTCGFTFLGDLINTDPLLGPLQNNGGQTDTQALPASSPAVDAGTNTGCPAVDQRGVARPFDGNGDGTPVCDIGAYEFNLPPPASADLSLAMTVDNPTPIVGGTITFTLTVRNAGPDNATGIAATDLLPAGYTYTGDSGSGTYNSGSGVWTVGALSPGASASHSISVTVNATGPYTNSAQITAAGQIDPDSTPNNGIGNGEDDEATLAITPLGTADLSLTLSVNNPTPNVGGAVVFTVTVSNAGPSAATGVTATDLLPAGYTYTGDNSASTGTTYASGTGLWTIGALAAGASIALNVTVTVNAAGPYTNAAQVTASDQTDPDSTPNNGIGNGEDDQASQATTPTTLSAVALSKSVTRREVTVGGLADYLLTVENISGGPLSGVSIGDQTPPDFKIAPGTARLVRAGPDAQIGTADDLIAPLAENGARPVLFGPFDLAAGESVQIRYVLRVGSGVFPGDHTNRATPLRGSVPIGNTASATVEVRLDPTFDLSTIIGKVFQDSNRNGWQDPDEPGVPGAMVALDDGTYAVTDEGGRYHLPAVKPGQRMVKINRYSLPPGAEIVTDSSRVLWVSPGLIARANFGVLVKTDTETIGRPAQPGLAVTGEARENPIEVLGSVDALLALVNGTKAPFPSGDVQMAVEGVDDIARLGESGLEAPIKFAVLVGRKPAVREWTLTILDEEGVPFRTFRGSGAPRRTITWDGRSEAGELVRAGGVYQYQLGLLYADGSRGASARRSLGVNRSRRILLRLKGDAFISGKADLSEKARQALDKASAALKDLRDERVVIEGYTDSAGSPEFNRLLSRRRAETAATYLHETLGVPANRIVTTWYGPDRPIASNETADGRAMNRRVEISVQARKVTRARLRDHYRAPPAVEVNGTPVEVGRDGRFAVGIPPEGADRVKVAMSDREGRLVEASVPIPPLSIASPLGRHVLPFGGADDVCRAEARPAEDARKATRFAATCSFRGSTGPGDSVEFNGAPLKTAADGTFAAELELQMGDNVYGLLVRDRGGHTRIASLEVAVADRDESGLVVIAEQAIPHLAIDLPPAGAALTSGTLGLAGRTDPGSRVAVNGQRLEVGRDGGFGGVVDLPEGASPLVVEVTDREGRVGRIEREVRVGPPPLFLMALADGAIGRLKGKGFVEAAGLDEGTGLFKEGRVALYLKGTIAGKYLITAGFDSDRGKASSIFGDLDADETRRLLTNLDPDKFYPVYGDGGSVVYDVQSQAKLYVALESETIKALYGNYPLSLTDTELMAYRRTLHGGRLAYESLSRTRYGAPDTRVVLFEAEGQQTHVHDELRATGGSLYYLSQQNVVEGSEEVTLVVRDKNTGLVLSRDRQRQNVDYTIKYEEGRVNFQRAIGSVAPSGSLVDAQVLSGHPVFIQVDYEAVAQAFEKTSYGARARRQLGDHVALGATYVEDRLGAAPYDLKGLDAEIRLGANSRITTEYAESDGADSATFVSEDGGVSFTSVPTTGLEKGSAFKAAADLDVGEWFGRPDRFRLRGYVKDLNPGFFSNGNLSEQGTEKAGVQADWKIGDSDTVHLRREREDRNGVVPPGGVAETTISSAQWDRRNDRWGVGVELLENEARDDAGDLLRRSQLGAARFWSKLSEKLLARLERQETLGGPANDRTTLDLEYHLVRSLALTARGTDGSLGRSAEAGAVLAVGDGKVYATERAIDDRAGERTATVFGARAPIGPNSTVYTEYQWEDGGAGGRQVSLLGVQRQWEITPGFRVVAGGETADVTGGSLVRKRSAGTLSLSYSNDLGLTAVTRQQIRFESGTTPREQVLSLTQIDYHVNPSVTLLGKFRYSRTLDRDSGEVEARLEERGVGFAYRPVTHDRFNALARYSRVLDLRPPSGAPLENPESILDVIALDTAYDLGRRVEWLSKLASRTQEERLDGVPPVRSRSWLAIQRLNIAMWKQLAYGIEYRVLRQKDTDDQRQGWLTEIMWTLQENFRIGGGFNFTDFSDDAFSANHYSVTGWFLRVQGKY